MPDTAPHAAASAELHNRNGTASVQNLEEVAWAAGLFEGEGSFGRRRDNTVLLSLSSTDLDVIEHFQRVIGTGRISSQPAGRNGRRKRIWRVDVSQVSEVLRIIDLLRPLLGERRRQRADEVEAQLRARIEAATFERACPSCGVRFRPPFAPNAARTKYCSRRCEHAWSNAHRAAPRILRGQRTLWR